METRDADQRTQLVSKDHLAQERKVLLARLNKGKADSRSVLHASHHDSSLDGGDRAADLSP